MKVTLLNPDEVKNLFTSYGTFAAICYDNDTKDPAAIGKHCMNSGHFSGSRSEYIKFRVDECPRLTIDQVVRQSVGITTNVQSFRYVNKDYFAYEIPSEIIDNQGLIDVYEKHMMATVDLYEEIQAYVLAKTGSKERANEQARYILPMSTRASFCIGFTLEALIHFMNIRLCSRAEDKIRELARLMKNATLEVLPELKDKLVPQCQSLLYCPEGKQSCGAYITKNELKELIDNAKCKD